MARTRYFPRVFISFSFFSHPRPRRRPSSHTEKRAFSRIRHTSRRTAASLSWMHLRRTSMSGRDRKGGMETQRRRRPSGLSVIAEQTSRRRWRATLSGTGRNILKLCPASRNTVSILKARSIKSAKSRYSMYKRRSNRPRFHPFYCRCESHICPNVSTFCESRSSIKLQQNQSLLSASGKYFFIPVINDTCKLFDETWHV